MNHELIKKYLENRCSDEERIQVEQWLEPVEFSVSGCSETEDDRFTKDKMWQDIEIKTHRKGRTRVIRLSKYAAAAVVLLLFSLHKEDLLIAAGSSGDLLQIEQITYVPAGRAAKRFADLHLISNPTATTIQVKSPQNGRIYNLAENQSYLHVQLAHDPGVVGQQELLLTADQLKMLPDVPLAGYLAAAIDQRNLKPKPQQYL